MRYGGEADPGLTAIRQFIRPAERLLLILGHPRCGSAFAAKTVSSIGMEIGHEMLGKHGMSSWMFAVQDLRAPFGRGYGLAPMSVGFKTVIHHLRDPFDAAPSIMIENKIEQSMVYRASHIQDAFGFDILQFDKPLDRAVASYLFWNKIVELHRPKFVFRIENDVTRLMPFLRKEFAGQVDFLQTRRAVGHVNTYNDHFAKYGIEKPVVEVADWSKLSPLLAGPLKSFCNVYGYEYRL